MKLSDKQQRVLSFSNSDDTTLLTVGTIRSGKTFSTVLGMFLYTQGLNTSYKHLIAGRKLRVIEQEVLPQIKQMADAFGVDYYYRRGEQLLIVGAQTYFVVAGNDETSLGRVQGLTIHSVFVDEATLVPESFFNTCFSRMSYGDSKGWVTCNPSYPLHWLKTKWVDEGRFDQAYQFTFEDNPVLSDTVIDRNKSLFTGVFAKRMVEGLWAAAEGLVYKNPHVVQLDLEHFDIVKSIVSIDYGTASVSAITNLMELKNHDNKRRIYVNSSEHIEGGTDLINKTDDEIGEIADRIAKTAQASTIIVDPSAASLIATLKKWPNRKWSVRKAHNDVLPGIRTCENLFASQKLTVNPQCTELVKEINSYSWDETKEDTVIKKNDHHCDAVRYGVVELIGKQGLNNIALPHGY